jgi:hypothetical protein
MNGAAHRKNAFVLGGHGRHMENKVSRRTKRYFDRRVDKRRRQRAAHEDQNYERCHT